MSLESQKAARIEDPGAELLDQARSFWDRSGRVVLIALGVVAVVAGGWFYLQRSRAATESQAAGKLAEASLLFWQGQYDQSYDAAKKVAETFPASRSGVDAHRLAGDNAFWNGMYRGQAQDFKNAITEYRTYLGVVKSGPLANAARRSLAAALESDHQYDEAARTFDQLVGVFDRESSAEFLASSARCLRSAGKRAEAIGRLQRLVNEFGETSQAPLARVRMAELQTATP